MGHPAIVWPGNEVDSFGEREGIELDSANCHLGCLVQLEMGLPAGNAPKPFDTALALEAKVQPSQPSQLA